MKYNNYIPISSKNIQKAPPPIQDRGHVNNAVAPDPDAPVSTTSSLDDEIIPPPYPQETPPQPYYPKDRQMSVASFGSRLPIMVTPRPSTAPTEPDVVLDNAMQLPEMLVFELFTYRRLWTIFADFRLPYQYLRIQIVLKEENRNKDI